MASIRRLASTIGLLPVVTVGIILVVAIVAIRTERDADDRLRPGAGNVASEIVHVHGIGVNPADDLVYVAAHTGLFRFDERGRAHRVADRYQDTMGFTVVGPDQFLASGHPDLREGGPSVLGLIRSEDAGETWSDVSLSGEADLHAIEVAHDRIYAADATAGVLRVSFDGGESWGIRGDAELAALAVDPGDPERIVGLNYDGRLMASFDGGRTWRAVGGPTLTALAWDEAAGLVGIDADGGFHSTAELGGAWDEIGDVGGGGAVLTANDGVLDAALDGGRILRSTDGGRSWDEPAQS